MIEEIEHKLTVRFLRVSDYPALRDISLKAYKDVAVPWTEQQLARLIQLFPEGQICIEDKGRAVAIALSVIIDFSLIGDQHSYDQIVSNGTFKSHD
ncbi:MAG: hydrolase, partial [Desulforhopalus sp.]|nr:hydrolase [Desulforhopalus sp.]